MKQYFITKHIAIFCILTLVIKGSLYAQTVTNFSGWASVFSTTKLSSKFSLHLEAQVRSNNDWKEVQTVLLRTGLNYNIKTNQVVTVGYALIENHRSVDDVSGWGSEQRIWEQFILNTPFSLGNHFVSLQNRFRLEQRFISTSIVTGDELQTDGYVFSQRFRYFARAIYPFSPTPKQAFVHGTFFSLQDEIFVNLGDASGVNGKFFDQNRAYFSLGYRFSTKYDLEIGYMNQFVIRKGSLKTINNIIQFATYLRL